MIVDQVPYFLNRAICLFTTLALVACASAPQIAVDPKSIRSQAKYKQDMNECQAVAENYTLDEGTAKTAVVGAAAGGGAAAGVAAAVAGAVFWPAIPFIAGAALVVGTGSGGVVKVKEAEARETIMADCLSERGYKTYKATNSANATPNAAAIKSDAAYTSKPENSPLTFSQLTAETTPRVTPRPAKTGFADISDISAVPYLTEANKLLYEKFLTQPLPRAFAIAPSGNIGWAYRGNDPVGRALMYCEQYAKQPCTLYAVDNDVVFINPKPVAVEKPVAKSQEDQK